MITDGAPKSRRGREEVIAMEQIRLLKLKGITIVTIATGTDVDNLSHKMENFLKEAATSPDLYFKANKKDLISILKALVDASCLPKQGNNVLMVLTEEIKASSITEIYQFAIDGLFKMNIMVE